MSKFVMVTDIHFGCRGGNEHFFNAMRDFWTKQLIPYLVDNEIFELYVLGDFMDSRRSTDYRIVKRLKEEIMDYITGNQIKMTVLCGNHDIFYRNSNEIVSYETFLKPDSIHSITTPYEKGNVLMMPWINSENYDECITAIEKTKCEYLMGHLELSGAKMYANSVSEHGMSPTIFKKFKRVFSGHFHHASQLANINYIGAAGYYTWQDYNDFRGFSVYDTDTDTITQVKNEYCTFFRFEYTKDVSLDVNMSNLKNKMLQLVVKDKDDINHFNSFIKLVQDAQPIDLKIVDETIKELNIKDADVNVEFDEDVLKLLTTQFTTDTDAMTKLCEDIYKEAAIL